MDHDIEWSNKPTDSLQLKPEYVSTFHKPPDTCIQIRV